jgi:hypothetical protein
MGMKSQDMLFRSYRQLHDEFENRRIMDPLFYKTRDCDELLLMLQDLWGDMDEGTRNRAKDYVYGPSFTQ